MTEDELPRPESAQGRETKAKKRSKTKRANKEKDTDVDDPQDQAEKAARRELRRARKMVERLAELGLDEHGQELDNFSLLQYPVREIKLQLPFTTQAMALNPAVTLLAVIGLLAIVWWTSRDQTGSFLATLLAWRTQVAMTFTWFFQGSKAVFVFFLLYIVVKFGHVHLGLPDDKPEFGTLQTIVMIFAAGTGPVMLVYNVAETMFHQNSHYYAKAGYRSQDEVDMFGLNLAVYSWTFLAWPTFTLVAVATALSVHRFGLPLTFRSCFFPLLGAYTWGWMGDVIDGMAIVLMILATVCMLCLCTIQIATGFGFLEWSGIISDQNDQDEVMLVQKTTVWILTIVSIASVMSGLHGGIKYMALVSTGLVVLLWTLVLCLDDTKYLLNLIVQTVGFHMQNSVFQVNFWTDAFGQLDPGSGRAIDDHAAEQWWMSSWIVFYQAWTVALGCVFGVFVACLCKGRKIWELVTYCWFTPAVMCLLWVCVWGGIGLRQARQAMELQVLGSTFYGNNSAHFLNDGSDMCYTVPQESIVADDGTAIFTNHLPGVSPVCVFDEARSNLASFHVLKSFHGPMGAWLIVLSMLGCVALYITMSDAASFMVDNFASNGRKNNHWVRRLFWASSVGIIATTLLSLGGPNAVKAIESVIIVAVLPVAFLLCYLIPSIVLLCRAADAQDTTTAAKANDKAMAKNSKDDTWDYPFPTQPEFQMPVYGGIMNSIEYVFSLGHVNAVRVELGMDRPTLFHVTEFVKGVVIPFVSLHQVLSATYPENSRTNCVIVLCYGLCYVTCVSLWFASFSRTGLGGLAATLHIVGSVMLAWIRRGYRTRFGLRSNVVADVVASLILWPQVVTQLRVEQTCRGGHSNSPTTVPMSEMNQRSHTVATLPTPHSETVKSSGASVDEERVEC